MAQAGKRAGGAEVAQEWLLERAACRWAGSLDVAQAREASEAAGVVLLCVVNGEVQEAGGAKILWIRCKSATRKVRRRQIRWLGLHSRWRKLDPAGTSAWASFGSCGWPWPAGLEVP